LTNSAKREAWGRSLRTNESMADAVSTSTTLVSSLSLQKLKANLYRDVNSDSVGLRLELLEEYSKLLLLLLRDNFELDDEDEEDEEVEFTTKVKESLMAESFLLSLLRSEHSRAIMPSTNSEREK